MAGAPKREKFYDDPGKLARWYGEKWAADPTLDTPRGRQAAARGLSETYGVQEKQAARYLFYYFPNTTGQRARKPVYPERGARKRKEGAQNFQCRNCHTIFAGPDYRFNPGKSVRHGPSGTPVTPDYCGEECARRHLLHLEANPPTGQETEAAAENARARYRQQYLRRGK